MVKTPTFPVGRQLQPIYEAIRHSKNSYALEVYSPFHHEEQAILFACKCILSMHTSETSEDNEDTKWVGTIHRKREKERSASPDRQMGTNCTVHQPQLPDSEHAPARSEVPPPSPQRKPKSSSPSTQWPNQRSASWLPNS